MPALYSRPRFLGHLTNIGCDRFLWCPTWGLRPNRPELHERHDAVLLFTAGGTPRVQRGGKKKWATHQLAEDETDIRRRRPRSTAHHHWHRSRRVHRSRGQAESVLRDL